MFIRTILGLTLSCSSALAVPSNLLLEVNGKIFPKESFPESCKNLFLGAKCDVDSYGKYHFQSVQDGDAVYNRVTFSGPEGEQVLEQSWEKNGKVKKAIIENRAIKKLSQLEVKDGKIYYQVTDLTDQSVKKSEATAEDNLVVSSTIMSYIKPHFEEITKGNRVQIKVAVLDRRDSFTFNIKKIKDYKALDGEEIQVLEMAPASLIVSVAVKPMYFYVKPKSGEMFAFEGESGLRRKVGTSYEKMQVRTAYEYKSKQECDPTAFLTGKTTMKCEVKQ